MTIILISPLKCSQKPTFKFKPLHQMQIVDQDLDCEFTYLFYNEN